MARKCPNCFATVPATKLLPYTSDLVCPSCGSPLEVSALSRNLSAFVALAAAAIVWRLSSKHYAQHPGALGWVFPVLFSYLTYSVVAPLVLILTGDLDLREVEASPAFAEPAAPSHGAHH
ncbi:MAG TPA: hypothetical protein VLY23_15965 [Candidatus Acidoferrum sp.]|nr:hypothetical protein [Candidatus Acidoferrum sp.]